MYNDIVKHINQRYEDSMPKKKKTNNFNSYAHDKSTWENDPVITDEEEAERQELIDKAKKGCAISIETLKRAPFSLKKLILSGQKLV